MPRKPAPLAGDTLGERLIAARERAGLTQYSAAELSGVPAAQLSLIETGKRVPRWDTLLKIAGAVGLDVGELAGL